MEINNLDDIIRPLQAKKQFFRDTFGVLQMGIFGSFAQGVQIKSSDIDIVIEMEKSKKNLSNFLALKRVLEKEFDRPVDLGFEHTLKPVVRENIKDKIIYV
jgi:predicted nucleotidyltransferase